jgi:endonuclease/exonuclease/phosphatase family metal-dependent hydrolase
MPFRIATYNVMNLFSRAKPLAVADWAQGRPVLEDISRLNDLLSKQSYTAAIKTEIAAILKRNNLANKARKDDKFRINQIRKKLYTVPETGRINVKAAGRDSWHGWIELVRQVLDAQCVQNTARVIDAVDADVLCLVEVEDRLTLDRYHDDILVDGGFLTAKARRYRHNLLVDGNDLRGIDVGLYSRFLISCVYSHIDDTYTSGNRDYEIFSRDCPEFCVELPSGDTLWVLVNHLKSKGYGSTQSNNRKRERQAERIKEILKGYDLTRDLVVVAGDFNDTPDSDPLQPVLTVPHLYSVLDTLPEDQRWTYKGGDQIDYLLVSQPLRDALGQVGVERRGIYRQAAVGNPAEMFPEVEGVATQASDHGAVWADVNL